MAKYWIHPCNIDSLSTDYWYYMSMFILKQSLILYYCAVCEIVCIAWCLATPWVLQPKLQVNNSTRKEQCIIHHLHLLFIWDPLKCSLAFYPYSIYLCELKKATKQPEPIQTFTKWLISLPLWELKHASKHSEASYTSKSSKLEFSVCNLIIKTPYPCPVHYSYLWLVPSLGLTHLSTLFLSDKLSPHPSSPVTYLYALLSH